MTSPSGVAWGVLAERVGLLRLLGLLGGPAAVGLAALMLVTTLLPAATAVAIGVTVGRVNDATRLGAGLTSVMPALLVVGVLLLVDSATQRLVGAFRNWSASQINGGIRSTVRRAVSARPGVDHLEDQLVGDAATLPVENAYLFNLGAGAEGQLWLLTRFVGAGLAAAVVGFASPLAGAVLLIALVWQRSLLRRHYAKAVATAVTDTVADGRAAAYWADVAGAPPAAKELRIFGLGRWAVERFGRHAVIPVRALEQIMQRAMKLHVKVFALNAIGALVAFGLISRAGAQDQIEPALLAAGLGGVLGVMRILGVMGWEAYSIEAAVPLLSAVHSLERFSEDERANAARRRPPAAEPLEEPPSIRFDDVWFRYPGTDHDVFRGLDVELRPRESVAIVGENGVGKTTLLHLLAGFYAPTSGRILIDGQDLREIDPTWWRQHLAVIFQDFTRLELTAIDNVALSDLDGAGNLGRADDAARRAGAWEIVERLPQGWETVMSTGYRGGLDLSGGQWQRVALARALFPALGGALVLVLDEPTASLDAVAETAVFDQLMDTTGRLTSIVVSHRFSTVRRAKRIVVLSGGKVIEDGSHAELTDAGGTYARLYRFQADRFRDETSESSEGTEAPR